MALLLVVVLGSSWALLRAADTASGVPVAWPAAGLLTGLLVVVDRSSRTGVAALAGALIVVAHLLVGDAALVALGSAVSSVLGSWVAWRRLRQGLGSRPVGLVEEGDVSRLIAAATLGSAVAAAGVAGTLFLADVGNPLLAAIATFGTHAAAQLMLLPLFLEGPEFAPYAPRNERLAQVVLVLGTTIVIFGLTAAPPLVFAVMPMFGWLAFRGTLREASLLLLGVGVIATVVTTLQLGPVYALGGRYDLPAELVVGYLQLFLIDCALILLPLSVMTTQQRMSAARAQARQQTLERLVDSATGSAVLSVGSDGQVVVFNPGAEAMFGRSATDVVGGPADLLFSDAELGRHAGRLGSLPVFADLCASSVAAEEDRHLWQVRRPDGDVRALSLVVTEVLDELGARSGYLCVADDVTEREAAHAALVAALDRERAAVERLQELEQVKADFVATVSHELRTPLTSMIGYVELLEDGAVGELAAEQRAVVNRLERNGRRLLLLVEDLLLLSQIEAREMRFQPVECDLRDAARAAYDALGPLLATRHLDTVLRLPDEPVRHEGDPEQVERLVLNLIGNGVKFTPDGGRVELVVRELCDQVEVVVLDTGMGIPADEQDQLFTRFFRASTATAQAIQGTGLGLTIVQAIVERHGGRIAVSSSEGVGTTVSVSLPKRVAAEVGQSATP
ncbi:ATP-binding protein [Nocardioides sp. GXQ0305]|uniref:ATP-binding protein n=1 Tax=Nocardioides sp. GXQ0305 TaxID=3423912 RepID=UPI003D7DB7E6